MDATRVRKFAVHGVYYDARKRALAWLAAARVRNSDHDLVICWIGGTGPWLGETRQRLADAVETVV